MTTLTIKRPDEENVEFYVDGDLVGLTNHDDVGWRGMELMTNTLVKIASKLGWNIEEEDE